MDKSKLTARLEELKQEIQAGLTPLKDAINNFVNKEGDIDELLRAREQWKTVRQGINNENIGVVAAIQSWGMRGFPLSGDPTKDAGQKNENPVTGQDYIEKRLVN